MGELPPAATAAAEAAAAEAKQFSAQTEFFVLLWIWFCGFFVLKDYSTALGFGAGCLAVQCFLTFLYAFLTPQGPWVAVPAFTAHQSITLPLYAYVAFIGCAAWWHDPSSTPATVAARSLELLHVHTIQATEQLRLIFGDCRLDLFRTAP